MATGGIRLYRRRAAESRAVRAAGAAVQGARADRGDRPDLPRAPDRGRGAGGGFARGVSAAGPGQRLSQSAMGLFISVARVSVRAYRAAVRGWRGYGLARAHSAAIEGLRGGRRGFRPVPDRRVSRRVVDTLHRPVSGLGARVFAD